MNRIRVDLFADRFAPFEHRFEIIGEDLSDATFAMQIRVTPDAPGAPVLDVPLVDFSVPNVAGIGAGYIGIDTVQNLLAAKRLSAVPDGLAMGDTVQLSTIQLFFNTYPFWPVPGERGEDVRLAYDIQVKPSGKPWDVWFWGDFWVRAGVTEAQS